MVPKGSDLGHEVCLLRIWWVEDQKGGTTFGPFRVYPVVNTPFPGQILSSRSGKKVQILKTVELGFPRTFSGPGPKSTISGENRVPAFSTLLK